MKTRPATIKYYCFNAFAEGCLRCQGTDRLCARRVGREFVRSCFAGGRSGDQCQAGNVINELDVNVLVRETDAHARTIFGAADFLANAPMTQLSETMFLFGAHRKCRVSGIEGYGY